MFGVNSSMVKALLATLPQTGKLEWIGVRNAHRGEVQAVEATEAVVGLGLAGDHRSNKQIINPQSKRQVTLMQAEHLPVIASLCAIPAVEPEWLRRNLLVSGINLLALKDRSFRIGEVLLEGTGPCQPCSRIEENLGPGAYNAMRGHGGITARIIEGGIIRVGEEVKLEPQEPPTPQD